MASRVHLPQTISRPISGVYPNFRQIFNGITFPSTNSKNPIHKILKKWGNYTTKFVIKLSLQEKQSKSKIPPKSTVDVQRMVEFLYEDLDHLFDDQGIDRTAYDERVMFRDPITKIDTISGYLFNIAFLKQFFRPVYQLHWAKQTGQYEINTRWTVMMTCTMLPWKPELVFTGTSVMGINPETGKFCSHVDHWDSVKSNDYFSMEGLWDVLRQLRMYRTPDLETPKYQILKRTADYEIRKYAPFIVVETQGDKLSGAAGINSVAGKTSCCKTYHLLNWCSAVISNVCSSVIYSEKTRIPMTTPVLNEADDSEGESKVSVQIILPQDKDLNSLPEPNHETISLGKVAGDIAAAMKFSGKPTEEIVRQKERELRGSLIKDGLRPRKGCLLARYNDPDQTWEFIMRNEVLIWLEDFRFYED